MPTHAAESRTRRHVADAPRVDCAGCRLQHDRERRVVDQPRALEQGRQRVEPCRKLLATEYEQRDIARGGRIDREIADELQRHSNAALHVGGAEPMHHAVLDPPGKIVLRRNRVVVPGEHDEWQLRTPFGREEERVVA